MTHKFIQSLVLENYSQNISEKGKKQKDAVIKKNFCS